MKATIQAKLAAALSGKLADATQPLTLKRVEKTADKVRGTFTEMTTEYVGRGVCRLSWGAREAAALNIPQTDGKAIILQSEIDTIPQSGDLIDFGDGYCKVIFVWQDPARATWKLQYRKA
ncbi:hypothetical protein PL75_03250 [Neisseria arctica]|uniref:Phage tail protein n=1 Tax=Neisseria arctica TaxID=1470200 RepID=A0A0J0YT30_9NEIS|nr:hypothetical protein [Neisseria arctica]KLT73256.1 hypothetical protein PL75_03250 [Neisseria arctica]UOO87490.1 hypothetical protein LVJ86_04395 [Neisseria arctica]